MSTQTHVNVHNSVTRYSEKEETKQILSLTGTTEVCRPALYPSGHTVLWWQSQDYQIYQRQCCFHYSNFPPVTNDTKGSKRRGVRANKCWLIIFNILKPIGCQPCVKVFGHYYLLCPFPDEKAKVQNTLTCLNVTQLRGETGIQAPRFSTSRCMFPSAPPWAPNSKGRLSTPGPAPAHPRAVHCPWNPGS